LNETLWIPVFTGVTYKRTRFRLPPVCVRRTGRPEWRKMVFFWLLTGSPMLILTKSQWVF